NHLLPGCDGGRPLDVREKGVDDGRIEGELKEGPEGAVGGGGRDGGRGEVDGLDGAGRDAVGGGDGVRVGHLRLEGEGKGGRGEAVAHVGDLRQAAVGEDDLPLVDGDAGRRGDLRRHRLLLVDRRVHRGDGDDGQAGGQGGGGQPVFEGLQ